MQSNLFLQSPSLCNFPQRSQKRNPLERSLFQALVGDHPLKTNSNPSPLYDKKLLLQLKFDQ